MDPRDEDGDRRQQHDMMERRKAIEEEERLEREQEESARAEEERRKLIRMDRSAAELKELNRLEIERERWLLAFMPKRDFDPSLPLEDESMY
jgi:hypothetical protein